jgi:hypothetical protein
MPAGARHPKKFVDRTNITLLKLLLVDVALESLEAEQI